MTRLMSLGSSRGTAAARATAYVRLATRQPSAAGNSHGLSSTTAVASTQARNARVASVVPSAQRRPCRNRSSSGPMSGASSTNGAMVSTRNRATRPRASSVGQREDGAGERDGEGGIRGDVDGVQLGEPGEPGVGGAVGVGEPSEPPAGRRPTASDQPDAGPPAATDAAARAGHPAARGARRRVGGRSSAVMTPRSSPEPGRTRERGVGGSGRAEQEQQIAPEPSLVHEAPEPRLVGGGTVASSVVSVTSAPREVAVDTLVARPATWSPPGARCIGLVSAPRGVSLRATRTA